MAKWNPKLISGERPRPSSVLAILPALASIPVEVTAAPTTQFGLSAGLGVSDNIARTADRQRSEAVSVVGLDGTASRSGEFVRFEIKGAATYIWYLGNTFDNELLARVDSEGAVRIVEERARWTIEQNFGQLQVDPGSALTPDNREDVSYFTTGPEIDFSLGSQSTLSMGAKYSQARFEVSELDADRTTVFATMARELSSRSKVSVNVVRDELRFGRTVDYPNYSRTSGFFQYSSSGTRSSVDALLGSTRVDDPLAAQAEMFGSIVVGLRVGAATAMSLYAGRKLTDAADNFRGLAPLGAQRAIVTGPVVQSPATFERAEAGLDGEYKRSRNEVRIGFRYADDTYSQSPLFDVETWEGSAEWARQLTPSTKLAVSGTLNDSNFRNAFLAVRNTRISIALQFRLSPNITISPTLEREERDATGVETDFGENRLLVTMRYGRN